MSAASLVRNPSHTFFKKEVLPSTSDLGIVEDYQSYSNHQEQRDLHNPSPPHSSSTFSHPTLSPPSSATLDNSPNRPVNATIITNQKEEEWSLRSGELEVGVRKQQQQQPPPSPQQQKHHQSSLPQQQQQQTDQQIQQPPPPPPTEGVESNSGQDRDSGAPLSSDTDSRQSLQLSVDFVTPQKGPQRTSQTPNTTPSEKVLEGDSTRTSPHTKEYKGVQRNTTHTREKEEEKEEVKEEEQTSFPRTGNLDFELELFLDKDGKEVPRSGSSDLSDRVAGGSESNNSVGSPKERERDKRSVTKREAKNTQQRPSVLRSKENESDNRVRSSSVGHKVRFTGQCSFGETDNRAKMKTLQHQQPTTTTTTSRTSRSYSRRPKKKMERSASEEAKERAGEAKQYTTLLREIHALMAEVQRQRTDFRNELRGLVNSISKPRQHRPCLCTGEYKRPSRLPVMRMSEQEAAAATKDVKETEEEKKKKETAEEKKKEEKKEDDKKREDEKEDGGRSSAGTSTPEPNPQENGEERSTTPKQLTLRDQFRNFSKFGDTKSDGKMLTLSQSDKWFKQAKVIDGKTISTTDTAITFNRFKAKKITFTDFEKYLDEISKSKKVEASEIKNKLQNCGAPGTSGTTSVVKSSAVDRLTDSKKFTGSHKLRFDTSTGRGKGLSGRKDVVDASGYVSGYKNKNTYDKSH